MRYPWLLLIRYAFISVLLSWVVVLACFIFVHGLTFVIDLNASYPFIIFFLPLVLFVTFEFERRVDRILFFLRKRLRVLNSEKPETLTGLMIAPLCWLSHLAGASVGRESVAVHLGRSIAQFFETYFPPENQQFTKDLLVRSGAAAGFSAVFGIPLTALVFAFEWVSTEGDEKSLRYRFLNFDERWFDKVFIFIAVALSSFSSNFFSQNVLSMPHRQYHVSSVHWDLRWIVFLICFFCVSIIFANFYQYMRNVFIRLFFKMRISSAFLAIVVPSFLLVLLYSFQHGKRYQSLGLPLIENTLDVAVGFSTYFWDPIAKSVVTAWSLAAGFRGGEVTPLLAMGSSLGFVIGSFLKVLPQSAAAVGYPLILARVMNIPVSCLVMSFEIFGLNGGVSGAVLCLIFLLWFYRTHINRRIFSSVA